MKAKKARPTRDAVEERPTFPLATKIPPRANALEEEHTVRAPLDPRVEAFNQRNTALALSIVQSRLGR